MSNSTSFPLENVRFGIFDYVLLCGMLATSTVIGIYYACTGGKQKTTQEFLLGNRSMTFIPVALSLLATFVSATTLLGITSEVYTFGSQHTFIIFGLMLLFPSVCFFFLPVYYELGITSVNEYLERRFNRVLRKSAALVYIVQTMLHSAVAIYAPSLAFSHATGLSFWASVLVIVGICTLYTTIGGIKAVMWTDVLQGMFMMVAILAIMIMGTLKVGGMANIWSAADRGGRLEFFNYSPDFRVRHTIWSQTIGVLFTTLPTYAVNQAQVQRYIAAHSLKTAKRALWGNLISWIWICLSCAFIAFILYARYEGCDPVTAKVIQRNDQLLPLFAGEVLGQIPGISGLFIAGLLSGSLSTLSTALNSLAAVTLEDFIKASPWGKLTERTSTYIVKGLAVTYAIICIGCIGMVESFSTVSEAALGISGLMGGPILGIFILGMFFPWTNSMGAGIGVVLGLSQSLWIAIGNKIMKPVVHRLPVSLDNCQANMTFLSTTTMSSNYTDFFTTEDMYTSTESISSFQKEENESPLLYLYSVSYMWYSFISCLIVIVSGLLISFATGPRNARDLDPRLFTPFSKRMMKKIPIKWRRILLCDIITESEMEILQNGNSECLLEKIPNNLENGKTDYLLEKIPVTEKVDVC